MKKFDKDPSAVLDYVWDWTAWLDTDIIQTFSFTIPDGLVEDSSSQTLGKVTLWLSGGLLNKSYRVTCKIVTVGGRTEERSAILMLVER